VWACRNYRTEPWEYSNDAVTILHTDDWLELPSFPVVAQGRVLSYNPLQGSRDYHNLDFLRQEMVAMFVNRRNMPAVFVGLRASGNLPFAPLNIGNWWNAHEED
jgi:hypothetical protein